MKEKKLAKGVERKLDFIATHKTLVSIKASEIKGRLSKKVSSQHINIVISGKYQGRYNNEFVLEILDKAIEIIEEKKAAITVAA